MNVLLLYPEIPVTFWSFKYALKFISKKSSHPPLGLITVAAMLPASWNKKLIDLNIEPMKDKDLDWADMVFISAMSIQRKSAGRLIVRCKQKNIPVVAGGPLFTEEPENYPLVDHLVLNEAEITFPAFLKDLEEGRPNPVYSTQNYPELKACPTPVYELLDMKKYAVMSLQLSRGCPYNCEFCEITGLFRKKVRLKTTDQILRDLEMLYVCHWRGDVFFVDDNFIGNRSFLKRDLLPQLIEWMEKRKHPFRFITEASVNLADDTDLMQQMVQAGFKTVFVGIETPNEESLVECNKYQNKNRNLLESVRAMHRNGLLVMGGFIVGFDHDTPSIFSRQIEFIKNSGIISAMVGLLNAPRKTRLYERLVKENRILEEFKGDNTSFSINFTPTMNMDELLNGYNRILHAIYSCKPYYARVKHFLGRYSHHPGIKKKIRFSDIKALCRSILVLGFLRKGRRYYWNLFFWSLFRRPAAFSMAVTYAIYGYHFRRVFNIR